MTQWAGLGETRWWRKPRFTTMGASARIQPQSKPIRLYLPLVPEEVTFMAIRHWGMEKRAFRLKKRVGITGIREISSTVWSCSGAKSRRRQMAA
jgi:hypothetical protein